MKLHIWTRKQPRGTLDKAKGEEWFSFSITQLLGELGSFSRVCTWSGALVFCKENSAAMPIITVLDSMIKFTIF